MTHRMHTYFVAYMYNSVRDTIVQGNLTFDSPLERGRSLIAYIRTLVTDKIAGSNWTPPNGDGIIITFITELVYEEPAKKMPD